MADMIPVKVFHLQFPIQDFSIVSQTELVRVYQEEGITIPPFIVFTPYFELNGENYYILPAQPEGT